MESQTPKSPGRPRKKVAVRKSPLPATPVEQPEVEAAPAPRPPRKHGMCAKFTYDGSSLDHDSSPAIVHRTKSNKPDHRNYKRLGHTSFHEQETKLLWGFDFPQGVEVEIFESNQAFKASGLTLRKLVMKALALDCFDVDCPDELTKPKAKRARHRRD